MNANLIFKWLENPHFAPEVVEAKAEAIFLPVEIEQLSVASEAVSIPPHLRSDARIEIELAGGHRASVEGGFEPDVLTRLLQELLS